MLLVQVTLYTTCVRLTLIMLLVQVTLYSMMCSERRSEVEAGILLYLKDLAMQLVPANYANKRGRSCFLLSLCNIRCLHVLSHMRTISATGAALAVETLPLNNLPVKMAANSSC